MADEGEEQPFRFTYTSAFGVVYGTSERKWETDVNTEQAKAAAMLKQAHEISVLAEAVGRLAEAGYAIAESIRPNVNAGSGALDPGVEEALRTLGMEGYRTTERRADDDEKPES